MSLISTFKSKNIPALPTYPLMSVVGDGFADSVAKSIFTFNNLNLATAATNRYIVVAIHARNSTTTPQISSANLGGVALTKIVEHRNTSSGLSISSFWGAFIPSGTTANLTVTFSASCARCMGRIHAVYNIDSLVPYATKTGGAANSNPQTLDIATYAPAILLATAHNNNNTSSATWTGISEQYDQPGHGTISGGSHVCTLAQAPRQVRCTFTSTISQTSGCSVVFYQKGAVPPPGGDGIVIVNPDRCVGCGECITVCPVDVFVMQGGQAVPVNEEECIGCESCIEVCDYNAITVNW